jgi:hypothetical protein
MQNFQKVSVEYLKALNTAIIHEKGSMYEKEYL